MISRVHFNEELTRLQHDILSMGTRVEEDLRKALEALRTGDVALAKEVKAGDAVVNAMQLKIEDQVAMLIATQQPVARDLRELVTMLKITDHLERIGDYAVHLAKTAKRLAQEPYPRSLERLEAMAAEGSSMLHDAVAAFLSKDEELARAAAARDDLIDKNHKAFIKEVLEFLRDNPDQAEKATKLVATSGFLERLGDHVTNVCESVIYMVSGSHVELNE